MIRTQPLSHSCARDASLKCCFLFLVVARSSFQFYEKDGKSLPGKKGISLNTEQYETLRDLITKGKVDREVEAIGK